ncbi:nucleoside monophosphate kinase [Patescibacteria group bacterium]
MADLTKGFPKELSKTKVEGVDKKFDLSDPAQRKEYFEAKVGDEIKALKEYFDDNTFIAYWLGKKSSGKGTYSKLMMEIFGKDKIEHISIGDVTRDVHKEITADEDKKAELIEYLKKNYRGYISAEEALDRFINKTQDKLLPTEFILTLVKREIDKKDKKTLFVDGFPRNLDQVSYSLYFRDLINYREDDDIFIGIDIPETVIDERMKTRVVCPKCNTPRSLKLFATKTAGHDEEAGEFYLKCDGEDCGGARMVAKEGDSAGIESIRARLDLDDQLIEKVFALHGVPKILLRNSIEKNYADEIIDDYEITPEHTYEVGGDGDVKIGEKPWILKNDEDEDAISLQAPATAISLIRQLAKILTK